MKRVVVTGGAGFIGSHLVERLLAEGHRVQVIDDCSTGRQSNLQDVLHHPRLQFHLADIADLSLCEPFFEGADWVFHLAALADIVPSIQSPLTYHRANVDGTVSALEASRRAGVKRFVYAASSSCYGIAKQTPTPETAPIQPQYPYALTKYVGELTALHWSQVYKLPVVSLRFFNVYGPRVRTNGTYGAVFGVFLAQKRSGRPYTVVGDGRQTRDFTYVSDVVDALITAAASNVRGEVFNVGSGGTYSINRLVDLLGGPKVHIPKRPGEPDCTFADTSRIRAKLDWTPQVSFEEGVANMLESLDDWREAPIWEPHTIADATKEWFAHLQ